MMALGQLPEAERKQKYTEILSRIEMLFPKYADSRTTTRVLEFLQLQVAKKLIAM